MNANKMPRHLRLQYTCILFSLLSFASHSVFSESERSSIAQVSLNKNPDFRGVDFADSSFRIYGDTSSRGVSIGGSIDVDSSDLFGLAYISYSYSFEEAITSAGLRYVNYLDINQAELFIEAEGREDYMGFTPRLSVNQGLEAGTTYVSFRFSRDLRSSNWLLNPNIEAAAGSYFSDSFELNHVKLGIDASRSFYRSTRFTGYVNVVAPMKGIENIRNDRAMYFQAGASIVFEF